MPTYVVEVTPAVLNDEGDSAMKPWDMRGVFVISDKRRWDLVQPSYIIQDAKESFQAGRERAVERAIADGAPVDTAEDLGRVLMTNMMVTAKEATVETHEEGMAAAQRAVEAAAAAAAEAGLVPNEELT